MSATNEDDVLKYARDLRREASHGQIERVKEILANMKAELNDKQFKKTINYRSPTDNMRTALMATIRGWWELAGHQRCRLAYGYPHNDDDNAYPEVQRLLLEAGADWSLKNSDGSDVLLYPRHIDLGVEKRRGELLKTV